MHNKLTFKALLCALLTFTSVVTHAETRPQGYDLGFFGGFWDGSRNVESSSYFGVSAAYHINRVFSLELNHGFVPTDAIKVDQLNAVNPETQPLTIQQGAANFVINLAPYNFVPFFNIGASWLSADGEVSPGMDVGFGAKYYLNDNFAVKANLTMWMADVTLRNEDYDHFTMTLGIAYSIAGKRDIDKDGVKNTLDKCPTTPEDLDQFEDGDGCPDKDNDEDGIEDSEDKCPDQAEDMDEDRDEDGCPDLDDDNDGITNEEDQCPNQPEDKDRFEDEDGCLDEDNDQDGILDTADKCPNEAESMNGFQDADGCPEADNDKDLIFDSVDRCKSKPETYNGFKDDDGCPDQISEALSSLLGLQPSLSYRRNQEKVKSSRAAKAHLDALATALKAEAVQVTIAVAAHKSKDNQALSQARANLLMSLLRERGVPASQMQAVGEGESDLPTNLEVKKGQSTTNWISITPWVVKPQYKTIPKKMKKAKKKFTKKEKAEEKPEKKAKKKFTKKEKAEEKPEKKAKKKFTKKEKTEEPPKKKAKKKLSK